MVSLQKAHGITCTAAGLTHSSFGLKTLVPDSSEKVRCAPMFSEPRVFTSILLQTPPYKRWRWHTSPWEVLSFHCYVLSLLHILAAYHPSQGWISPMSSPDSPALQTLHRLDRSSSNFSDQLHDILYEQEYALHEESLEHDDLVWLIDYLDEVCPDAALLRSPLTPA